MQSMLTESQKYTLLDLIMKLLSEAHHVRKKSEAHGKSWSVFWRYGNYEIDAFFCEQHGYRLGMIGVGTGINLIMDHTLTGFFEPPQIRGSFDVLVKQLRTCLNDWQHGKVL